MSAPATLSRTVSRAHREEVGLTELQDVKVTEFAVHHCARPRLDTITGVPICQRRVAVAMMAVGVDPCRQTLLFIEGSLGSSMGVLCCTETDRCVQSCPVHHRSCRRSMDPGISPVSRKSAHPFVGRTAEDHERTSVGGR